MFKEIDNNYRPIPFWSWNEKLNVEETRRQIDMMHKAGMGGFFMHARGGLQTEYMGEEWFENISVSVEEAKKRGMYAWAYDENGWPSGFGNGKVNGLGLDFQQKYLRYEEGEKDTEVTICNLDGIHFYYEVNPFYVDTLNLKATKMFIREIYEPYYDKYHNDIEGFFTDEPQISRRGIPWSFCLPKAYGEEYGEDLLAHLTELFRPTGDYVNTRLKFWRLITKLFSEHFMKPVYEWCDARGLKFTGHMLMEETMLDQLTTNGAAMPHYDYLHMPGMDWLGREIVPCLTPLQVASVAQQLGKESVLSETFALCGHNVGHEELKGILEWQMVNGITKLCQHLEGYSLRGIRKRDYPPAMYYQQPWWEDYKVFNDAMSRIGMILSRGKVQYDTLLLHPQSSAWVCYDAGQNAGLEELNQAFLNTIKELQEKHILFHLGDEIIMERHARVEGKELVIGTQRYSTIVLPEHKTWLPYTKGLLEAFKANGGTVVRAEEVEAKNVISCPQIAYTKRIFDDFELYYFVNSTKECYEAEITVGSHLIDIQTGELKPFDGKYHFRAFDSLLVIEDGSERKAVTEKKALKSLDLTGPWDIVRSDLNSITLDKCDYYFDGELIEEKGYVLNIQHRACMLKRPVQIRCDYLLDVDTVPAELYLVCETPEIFEIQINGAVIDKTVQGYFLDKSFQKISIADYVQTGINTITLRVLFKQSDKVYENLEKALQFESEKNKLTYDMEIEPVYVVGDFAVKCNGAFTKLARNACRYQGDFALTAPRKELSLSNIEQQGYPFFAGSITVKKDFVLEDTNYQISFNKYGINVIKVKVNGNKEQILMWEPFILDISKWLKAGTNEIEITMTNNLRNLLGPHHLEEGESYYVTPGSFYKEPCVWNLWDGQVVLEPWNDDYCFVEMGLI